MRHAAQILVVDDDLAANTALCALLADVGFVVSAAANGDDALERYESLQPELVLTDLQMPGLDGIELVKRIQALEDPAAVIVMTAFATIGTAIEAIRAGASEYITKPIELEHLLVLIEKALTVRALRRDARRPSMPRLRMVGSSPMMDHIFEVVDQVASSRASVLIFGESGTGKELVANALHERSPRAGARFVKVHCAALSESLLESELFGHERGAFTGAHERKEGRFEIADGGTLFLDEIGDISPSTQVKLLRFLQEHEFERVGGNQTIRVDVRILAATNRNLAADVASGRFREDLYYRLKVVEIDDAEPARAPLGRPGPRPALPAEVRRRKQQGDRWLLSGSVSSCCAPTRGRETCASSSTRSRARSCSARARSSRRTVSHARSTRWSRAPRVR